VRSEDLGHRYRIGPLDRDGGRDDFRCGADALDNYLKQQASQDVRRRVTSVWTAMEKTSGAIHGYYSLAMAGVPLTLLPADLSARMPRYPSVPAIRLGRLAVSVEARGQGLGTFLLLDSMHRALGNEVAWAAFVVDAKDDNARRFYERFGFASLVDDQRHLFLPRGTIEALFRPGLARHRRGGPRR
jgi:ribosomal protein S18 acetylase RimI-like enzyme